MEEEQLNVFNAFIENEYKHIVIQGIFGVGKSQMLLGLLI
jgi:DNA replication protein DnaC